MRWARSLYLPMLSWALNRRAIVVTISAVLIIAAVASVSLLGREFMPVMDEGAFDMDIQLAAGHVA